MLNIVRVGSVKCAAAGETKKAKAEDCGKLTDGEARYDSKEYLTRRYTTTVSKNGTIVTHAWGMNGSNHPYYDDLNVKTGEITRYDDSGAHSYKPGEEHYSAELQIFLSDVQEQRSKTTNADDQKFLDKVICTVQQLQAKNK